VGEKVPDAIVAPNDAAIEIAVLLKLPTCVSEDAHVPSRRSGESLRAAAAFLARAGMRARPLAAAIRFRVDFGDERAPVF